MVPLQQTFPRIIWEIERRITSYVTHIVEQKIRKHMRKVARQISKQKSLSPLVRNLTQFLPLIKQLETMQQAIGNVMSSIGARAQRQITRQLRRSLRYSRDSSNPLHTEVDETITISEFCQLDLAGQILMIECFQGTDHEFILVHSRGLYLNTPPDQLVWIRLERGLKESVSEGYFQAMFMKTPQAYNTATISYNPKSIAPTDASPIKGNRLVFQGLEVPVTLKHLVALLVMMDEVASGYNPLKDDCSVFCQAMIDCLEPYQSKAIRVRHPDLNRERRRDLKNRFTSSVKDLHSYGFTPDS